MKFGERGVWLGIVIIASLASRVSFGSGELGITDVKAFAVPAILSAGDVPDPRKLPPGSIRRSAVRIALCPGEVGLGSFCVYAGNRPISDVTLRISDLVAEEERIRSNNGPAHWKLPVEWRFRPDPDNEGKRSGWFAPDLDDANWSANPDGRWEGLGRPGV